MMKPTFEAVVADHGPTVLRVCLAVLGPVDADDAWSETFLSAMKAYPDLPDHADIGRLSAGFRATVLHHLATDLAYGQAASYGSVGAYLGGPDAKRTLLILEAAA
jgi:Sigma-70 region 2